jgi:hypothetical protein
MTDSSTFTHPSPPPLRRCGRCRLFFPTHGDLHAAELKEWWACDDCSTQITPSRERVPTNDGSLPAPGPT